MLFFHLSIVFPSDILNTGNYTHADNVSEQAHKVECLS